MDDYYFFFYRKYDTTSASTIASHKPKIFCRRTWYTYTNALVAQSPESNNTLDWRWYFAQHLRQSSVLTIATQDQVLVVFRKNCFTNMRHSSDTDFLGGLFQVRIAKCSGDIQDTWRCGWIHAVVRTAFHENLPKIPATQRVNSLAVSAVYLALDRF